MFFPRKNFILTNTPVVNTSKIAIDLINFGIKLKTIRKAKGLTKEKLAILASISESTVDRIETNKQNVGFVYVVAMCQALNTRFSDVLSYDTSLIKDLRLPKKQLNILNRHEVILVQELIDLLNDNSQLPLLKLSRIDRAIIIQNLQDYLNSKHD